MKYRRIKKEQAYNENYHYIDNETTLRSINKIS